MARGKALRTLHVASAQIVSRVGDVEGNLRQVEQLSKRAAHVGADLVLFGEGALTGYAHNDAVRAKAPTLDGPVMKRLRKVSREGKIVIIVGTIERSKRGWHVSHFVVFPNAKPLVQRKHRLTPTEQQEKIIPGAKSRKLFKVKGATCAIAICADSGIPGLRTTLARRGCEVFLTPCAGGGDRKPMRSEGDLANPKLRKQYLADMEKVCYIGAALEGCFKYRMAQVSCNLAGDDGIDHYHPGHSAIVDSRGRLVALRPGEYVVDFLQPEIIHGEIIVQKPRVPRPGS